MPQAPLYSPDTAQSYPWSIEQKNQPPNYNTSNTAKMTAAWKAAGLTYVN